MWEFGETKPYTGAELALWLDRLPIEAKSAIITSLITISGFIVAFHTATASWKAQTLAQIKLTVANEIEHFYSEVSSLVTDAEIFTENLVDTFNAIEDGINRESSFKVQHALARIPEFISMRQRLSAMSVAVHGITGRHYSLLSTVPGALNYLEDCVAALNDVTKKMWIRLPHIEENNNQYVAEFHYQLNRQECLESIECCQKNGRLMNGLSGAVRGALLHPIIGFNASSFINILGKKDIFKEGLKVINPCRGNMANKDNP